MDDKIKEAIEFLASRIKEGVSADDALKYTQAALNLAHLGEVAAETKL